MRTRKSFSFPVFCTLFIIYCIVDHVPKMWLMYGFLAFCLDLIINPLYEKETKE